MPPLCHNCCAEGVAFCSRQTTPTLEEERAAYYRTRTSEKSFEEYNQEVEAWRRYYRK